MEIFYIEDYQVPGTMEVVGELKYELRTVCFVKTTPLEFINKLGLDELYSTEVKLVGDIAPIYYDTTTKSFYKFFTSFKKEEFAKAAINLTLEHGAVMLKMDWKVNFLSPKMLIGKLLRRLLKDMINHDFQELYN